MRQKSLITIALLVSLMSCAASAATWTVGNKTAFDEGAYLNTTCNATGVLQLSLPVVSGNYTSKIFDAGSAVQWVRITETLRDNATGILYTLGNLTINASARSCGNISCSGVPWVPVGTLLSQPLTLPNNRYFQFRLTLGTDNASVSPEIVRVSVDYTPPAAQKKHHLDTDYMSLSAAAGCVGQPVTISATGKGSASPVSGVSITVRGSNPYAPKTADLKTGWDGKASFIPAKPDTYGVSADKDGYYDAKAFVTVADCGCSSDASCAPTEACLGGSCDEVECPCGVVRDHACEAYDCCFDRDCGAKRVCISNSCVEVSSPPPAEPNGPPIAPPPEQPLPEPQKPPEPTGAAVGWQQPAFMPILPALQPVDQGIPPWLPFLVFFIVAVALILALYDATRFKSRAQKPPEMPEWKKADLEAARKAAIMAAALAAEKTAPKVHKKRPPVPKRPIKKKAARRKRRS